MKKLEKNKELLQLIRIILSRIKDKRFIYAYQKNGVLFVSDMHHLLAVKSSAINGFYKLNRHKFTPVFSEERGIHKYMDVLFKKNYKINHENLQEITSGYPSFRTDVKGKKIIGFLRIVPILSIHGDLSSFEIKGKCKEHHFTLISVHKN